MGPLSPDAIRPVFIIGAGHSGTTIVYRMLSWHPHVAWLSQYSSHLVLTGGPLAALAGGAERTARRLVAHSWRKSRYPWARRFAPVPVEGLGVWRAVLDDGLPREEAVRRVQRLIETVCQWDRASVFLAKPPGKYRSRCAPIISSAFPRARYIHVLRDGRAVALSVLDKKRRAGGRGGPEDLLHRAARHWMTALAQIESYAPTVPVHHLRYEALCADVHGELRTALEFCGLAVDAFPFDRCPPTLASTNAVRLNSASAEDLRRLDAELEPYLRRYQYVGTTGLIGP
ncbi:MAG TPA: sulfotransferase [bacterium]|nr:sulfotransferase [bacterium]